MMGQVIAIVIGWIVAGGAFLSMIFTTIRDSSFMAETKIMDFVKGILAGLIIGIIHAAIWAYKRYTESHNKNRI